MKYSVVVPVYNEEGNITKLHAEIVAAMNAINAEYEIIFINDGSTDGTTTALAQLAPLTVIHFRRNFGQTAATDAGIKHASGEWIITMDGDGQNPPADIAKLIAEQESTGADVVSGWRAQRKDPAMKKFISRVANILRQLLINDGIHDSGCSLKLYRAECFANVHLYGEMHRFIPAVLRLKGFTIAEVAVGHRPRTAGSTKYTWRRTIKGFLDMIAVWFWQKYAARPMHLFGGAGFLLIVIALISGIGVCYQKLILNVDLSDTVLTEMTFFLFITGIVLLSFGLMSDMLSKLYFSASSDATYNIKTITTQHHDSSR